MPSPSTLIPGSSELTNLSLPSSTKVDLKPRPTLQTMPFEVMGLILSHLKSDQPRNVAVSYQRVGNTFEIYSRHPLSTELSLCRVARGWALKQYDIASLASRGGYKGSLQQIKGLHFNPELDLICPINESEWSSEAFHAMCEVMQATHVQRIAVSDCSYSKDSMQSPWANFYRFSNLQNWSPSFRETLMYTTKRDLNMKQTLQFRPWQEAPLDLNPAQRTFRSMQIHKGRPTMLKIVALKKAQKLADSMSETNGAVRAPVPGMPNWLFEQVTEQDVRLELKMMVETASISILTE